MHAVTRHPWHVYSHIHDTYITKQHRRPIEPIPIAPACSHRSALAYAPHDSFAWRVKMDYTLSPATYITAQVYRRRRYLTSRLITNQPSGWERHRLNIREKHWPLGVPAGLWRSIDGSSSSHWQTDLFGCWMMIFHMYSARCTCRHRCSCTPRSLRTDRDIGIYKYLFAPRK
jgi:hypothetical protein